MAPSAEILLESVDPSDIPFHKDDPTHEEHQYLDLIREILRDGELRPDR